MDLSELEDTTPSFDGKILLVMFQTSAEDHAVIESPRFERQLDRVFLVGHAPDKILPGFEGVRIALAWDEIQQYYILESVEHYLKARDEYLASSENDLCTPRTFFSYFKALFKQKE